MKFSVVILAAGQSSRMGRVKALLPLPLGPEGANCSALEGLARLYRDQGVDRIVVVSGYHAEEVEAESRRLDLVCTRNPNPEQGMFSSVCTGLSRLADNPDSCESEAICITPVDVPLVRPLTLQTLLEEAKKDLERFGARPPVLIPLFAGREGHPPLIPAAYASHILAHNGREGLRGAFSALPRRVVSVADAMILEDMDAPEDYERLRRLALSRAVLTPEEAWVLLRQRKVAQKILRHSQAVGEVAARFAAVLGQSRESAGEAAGCSPQLALVGGLLHDICKGAPHHELAGGDLLDSLGLPRLAEIVRSHLDVDLPDEAAITERELVCLADKYCLGIRLTPLESRYEEKKRQFRDNAEALTAIEAREQRAQKLAARLAAECGQSPFELARTALASLNLNEAGRH